MIILCYASIVKTFLNKNQKYDHVDVIIVHSYLMIIQMKNSKRERKSALSF